MAVAFSKIQDLFDWCFKPNKEDKKHKGWRHPIFSLFVMSVSCLLGCSYLANHFAGKKPFLLTEIPYSIRVKIGTFLFGYWAFMLGSRLSKMKSRAFYDMLWACNISILLAIFGLVKNSPLLVGTSLITISTDQILWYADILSYLIFGKFYIGVAGYLLWPETNTAYKITSTHHLWFIPLLGYILKKSGGLKKESFKVSVLLTILLWFIARSVLPKTLPGAEGQSDTYMNVNLSWELWKDVKIDLINKFLADGSYWKCMTASGVIWNSCNFLCFLLLKKMIQ